MAATSVTSGNSGTSHDTFDPPSSTWTLRSHAAVSAALSCTALAAGNEPLADETNADSPNTIPNAVRRAARDAFPATRLIAWRAELESSATELVTTLPSDAPIDLMRDVATPWSLDLALRAANRSAQSTDGPHLAALARTIFLDAACTDTGAIAISARDAATALASALTGRHATHTIDVQSFVALSQTLPHLLVAVWYALLTEPGALHEWRSLTLRHPEQREGPLRRPGDRATAALDELLRFAGPSRAVFRRARRDTYIGACSVATGHRVILMLHNANRDPLVFPGGDRLDLGRDASGHVAFGGGAHVCVGKPIILLALEVATTALFERLSDSAVINDVQWLDGFAIRAPSSLVVS